MRKKIQYLINQIIFLIGLSLLNISTSYAAGVCSAGTLADLKACAANLSAYDSISITADMACSDGSCCGANGAAMLNLANLSNKKILGNGHVIRRSANQKLCPALAIQYGTNITINGVTFDEDTADPCTLDEEIKPACARTIYVNYSSNVILDNIEVRKGKGYVVYIWGVNGFELKNSRILDSGIIGFYSGHQDYAPSWRVKVTNSTFVGSRSGAIAIEGASGSQLGDNAIVGNTILRSHWHGVFVDKASGLISDGGQLYIAGANNMLVQGNTIGDGYCENCNGNYVTGIELGFPNRAGTLNTIQISNNTIYNHNKLAIGLNTGSTVSNVSITGNKIVNNAQGVVAPGATISNNIIKPTQALMSWENQGDYPTGWNTWQQCSTGAQVVRWCPGSGVVWDGQCALRMVTSALSCNDGWQGAWVQGLYRSISPGTPVYLNVWSRNAASKGKVCLAFLSSTSASLGGTCKDITLDNVWRFNGSALVEAVAPAGTAYVGVQIGANSPYGYVDIDDVRLAW